MRRSEYQPAFAPAQEPLPENGEIAALLALGFSKALLAKLAVKARDNATSLERELLHCGLVDEAAYYGAMARLLRLPFLTDIDPACVVDIEALDTQLRQPVMLRINHRSRAPQVAVVPEAARLADLAAALAAMPGLAADLAVTTPSALRHAVWQAGAERRTRQTVGGLFERQPHLSARIVLTGQQGAVLGAGAVALFCTFLAWPMAALAGAHLCLSMLYLASLSLRSAAFLAGRLAPGETLPSLRRDTPLPRYTVMVALHREAEIAAQLVASLRRLDWPRALLDIKLVCEADDLATISALSAQKLEPHFEIVAVPPSLPRTKPKALTYALPSAAGEFLVIYDAEDRPHPQQLREAFARFSAAPENLACLQAPLIVTNAHASWLSALFSLEYSGLFRSLLPMLARWNMPLPLGGTSNHFRTSVLRKVGGWDPFNVTEDADLGLRLHRLGYRCGVMVRQTLEDAPVSGAVWMGQRRRWFKGWLQTWLVLMRDPLAAWRQLGAAGFCLMQLVIGGMLVSALLHPLMIVFILLGAYAVATDALPELASGAAWLLGVDIVNVVGSYGLFLGLGLRAMIDHEQRLVGWKWLALPPYWLMMSAAAWMAVWELRYRPFFWKKTPHRPVPS